MTSWQIRVRETARKTDALKMNGDDPDRTAPA
jgi:hypothetical protein